MIRTFNLSRNFGKYEAVKDVNLNIKTNEIFGFLGLNGAGKTTIMRMICGLLRPSNGYSQLGGVEVRGPKDTNKLIPILSFVSQEMKLYEKATLRELLPVYAGLASKPADTGFKFASLVDVPLNRPCNKFSPGQQRKAQLAIAMIKDPQYLILDEPTAGLDPKGVSEIREMIKVLQGQGKTIFFSSHILGEVQSLCTSVGILHQGRIHFQGPINQSFHINLQGDIAGAVKVLSVNGFSAIQTETGIQVDVSHDEIPKITRRLNEDGFLTGLVEPVSLESIFNRVTLTN
ncbi:MAG: hypothetical protein C0410_07050 [Anaerolinea sp.]|nr:hypothetical protein [Anaerolinea sp.]